MLDVRGPSPLPERNERKGLDRGEEGRYTMLNIHDAQNTQTNPSAFQQEGRKETPAVKPRVIPTRHWPQHLLGVVKRYPVPCMAVTLMLASLILWLAGRGNIADWTLLAVALLGGLPLLWETAQQVFHREFGVDLIAILAIGGSIFLREYLA